MSPFGTRIVTGRQPILDMAPLLVDMSHRHGQPGAMEHLKYFLTSESALRKTPHLVLVGPGMERPEASPRAAVGALLVYEYRLLGRGTGIFATDDTTGRRPLVAPPEERATVTKLAIDTFLRAGARVVLQSLVDLSGDAAAPMFETLDGTDRTRGMYAVREREIPSFLPLGPTLDATLARMGAHTRRNLRYYRRRAEAHLGATFTSAVVVGSEELQRFSRRCTYPVADRTAQDRYDCIRGTPGMFLCGIRRGDGSWLSMIGGRRYQDTVEVDWQMNRGDLPAFSLSTVMRAFFIEDEVLRGTRRMFLEGGTPHGMRYSFAMDRVRDLVVLNRSWLGGRGLASGVGSPPTRARLLLALAGRRLPSTNFVLQVLTEEGLEWKPWGLAQH